MPPPHPPLPHTHARTRPPAPPAAYRRRYEIDKLTASQRLDLNLEKGRMRDELQMVRDKTNELEIKVWVGGWVGVGGLSASFLQSSTLLLGGRGAPLSPPAPARLPRRSADAPPPTHAHAHAHAPARAAQIDKEVNSLKAAIEQSKNDTVKNVLALMLAFLTAGLGAARLIM